MSLTSTPVTAEHFRYLAARTRLEDDFLARLKREAAAAGIPPIAIAPEQASFLAILLKLGGARTVVEVGTLAGYSAIAMARALPDGGRLHTIEIDPARADFAARWIVQSDVAGRVTLHRGAAKEVLPRFADGSVDAMFLDADKANYPLYLKEAERLLRPRGLLLADNAFAFGQLFDAKPSDREVPAMRAFNDLLARSTAFHSVIVPLGDGCWVGARE
jgi:O-methyltransferase